MSGVISPVSGGGRSPNGDTDPAFDVGLISGAGITSLYAAIANNEHQKVNIPIIGDSVTEGQGADAFVNRWINRANDRINFANMTIEFFDFTSHVGLGFIPLVSTGTDSFDWPIVQVAGDIIPFLIGPVRNCSQLTDVASFTFTAPDPTTTVQVMYFDAPVDGTFTYEVNSGGPVTVTNGATGIDLLTDPITMAAGDILTIAWASGDVFLDGLIHFAGDENNGIAFQGCGHFGWAAGIGSDTFSWNQDLESGFNWNVSFQVFDPAAIGIMLGINDADSSGSNYTAPQFQANLETLIAYIRSDAPLADVPFLLIIPYQPDETFTSGTWAQYATAIRNVIKQTPNCTAIDLNYRMPTVASGFDDNLLYADEKHPNDAGHALIGAIASACVRIA